MHVRALAIILALICVIPAVSAVFPGDPGFLGCVMLVDNVQMQDTDCDRVPDLADNCPLTGNPEQFDVDANGIGDLCDLVIDEIGIEPAQPMQGRSVVLRAAVFNNRPYPMRNMILKAEVPRLGVTTSEGVPIIQPGERVITELVFRIPECAPATFTDIVVFAEYPVAPGQKEVFSNAIKVPVMHSGLCPNDPGEDLTVVEIIELQDVLPEQGAIYPFTIKNNWPESKAYILTAQGMENWGIAEIQPGSVMVVPPGGAREGAIQVWAHEGQEGMKSFTLSINARDDAKQVVLQADIKNPKPVTQPNAENQFLMGVLAFIVILVLIGLLIAFMSQKDKKKVHKSLEKIEKEETTPKKKVVKKKSVKKK